jgi:flagellar hook-basal body complex protein FliE
VNVAPITTVGLPGATAVSAVSSGGTVETAVARGNAFGGLVDQLLTGQARAEATAGQAVQALATGQAESMHGVSLAVAQADLSFRLILELRNRVTEAYQEVMRMQV